jgi:hypothetical protein
MRKISFLICILGLFVLFSIFLLYGKSFFFIEGVVLEEKSLGTFNLYSFDSGEKFLCKCVIDKNIYVFVKVHNDSYYDYPIAVKVFPK